MISYYNPFFDDGIVYSCDNLRLSFEFLSSDSGEHFLSWLSQFEYAYYRSSKPFAYKHLFVFGCKVFTFRRFGSSVSLNLCIFCSGSSGGSSRPGSSNFRFQRYRFLWINVMKRGCRTK